MVISKNGVLKAAWTGFPENREAELAALLDELAAEAKAAPVAADHLTILFTNNTNGLTGPAPAIEVGGLAKRMTLIKRERAASPASILVEAGDFFPTSPDEARTRKVVAAYKLMDYDAVTIGEAEFVNGLKFLRGLIESKSLPWVSANIKLCEGADVSMDLARPSILLPVGKRKVAVLGYMHPDAVGFTPEERFKDGTRFIKFTDPRPLIKAFLERYRKDADVVVVLSHAGVEEDRRLAAEVPGIDVIVGAHSQTFMTDPGREGGTIIVQAAADGQYLGKLVLKFGDNGKPAIESYELTPLTKNLPDDPDVAAAVAAGPKPPKAE
jgi:5'-nucleotidase